MQAGKPKRAGPFLSILHLPVFAECTFSEVPLSLVLPCFSYVPFQLCSYSSFNQANLIAFSTSICPNNREVGTCPWAAICLPLIYCVFALRPTAGLQVFLHHCQSNSSSWQAVIQGYLCPAAEGFIHLRPILWWTLDPMCASQIASSVFQSIAVPILPSCLFCCGCSWLLLGVLIILVITAFRRDGGEKEVGAVVSALLALVSSTQEIDGWEPHFSVGSRPCYCLGGSTSGNRTSAFSYLL